MIRQMADHLPQQAYDWLEYFVNTLGAADRLDGRLFKPVQLLFPLKDEKEAGDLDVWKPEGKHLNPVLWL